MPIVGIFNCFVINLAASGEMHSKTKENAPAFSINFASSKSFKFLFLFALLILNFFLNCGVNQYVP